MRTRKWMFLLLAFRTTGYKFFIHQYKSQIESNLCANFSVSSEEEQSHGLSAGSSKRSCLSSRGFLYFQTAKNSCSFFKNHGITILKNLSKGVDLAMRKLLSFITILSLLLSFAFPVAHAGTLTQAVQTAVNTVQYITAGEFVTSLLMDAKVKPNGIADYWGKAVSMGLIPAEVKKDKALTRAQASYIVWKLINSVPELKNKNIPVSVRRVPPTEAFMRGICFFGGPVSCYDVLNKTDYRGYDLSQFIQGYQLLILEYKYADGRTEIKYVWDRYKGINITPQNYVNSDYIFLGILNEFKQKHPDKVVYAPRPWQKGWLFTIDPYRDGGHKHTVDLFRKDKSVEKDGYPLSRADINFVTMNYHI
ncbi:hypothetical protein SOJ16_000716 [Caldicellulosiruptor danielii]|uniref:SLH domain-containing protein n=1 Tax=Anaerocellum danielii TaxID=1387557 RepID=A0ABZ0U1D0_9FIRM|nr:hypothetical protein [Caldicellulosiruptor danielii]WPX09504.1 hypothetical protein SOJ16_000716 [Caldicellulosiruptor danielii]